MSGLSPRQVPTLLALPLPFLVLCLPSNEPQVCGVRAGWAAGEEVIQINVNA